MLTVRYMQLVGQDKDRLYVGNSSGYKGKEHSGLSIQELKNPARLLAEYHHKASGDAVSGVLSTPLRRAAASPENGT